MEKSRENTFFHNGLFGNKNFDELPYLRGCWEGMEKRMES